MTDPKTHAESTVPAVSVTSALANPEALSAITENLRIEPLQPSDLDRVKVPAGGGSSWEVQTITGMTEVKELRGIILASKIGRSYWEQEYSGEKNPPDCVSLDGMTGRGTPGGDCTKCALNEYESARKGKGKACKETRSIMVLLEGDLLPTVLSVPPSSLKGWRGYVMRLSKSGVLVKHAITSLTLNKTKSSEGIAYSEIVFNATGVLNPDERQAINGYVESISASLNAAHAATVMEREDAPAPGGNPFADSEEDLGPAFPPDAAGEPSPFDN